MRQSEISKVDQKIEVHIRENIGYDFYSYKVALESILKKIAPNNISHVTLMNTSFICLDPNKLKQTYFDQCLKTDEFDVLGLTISNEVYPHIQTYLLTFGTRAIQDNNFIEWWEKMTPINERHKVIENYEIGFSRYLNKLGYKLGGMFNTNMGLANPTHGRFQEILDTFGILKIEVFKQNPYKLNLSKINKLIREDPQALAIIKEALEN
jgi:rhamnosyltransferase